MSSVSYVYTDNDGHQQVVSGRAGSSSNASLNGVPFRVNPMSVAFDYTVKAKETPTIGGRVVQIFGTTLGDLTLVGSFGSGSWPEQRDFLERMKLIANNQSVAQEHLATQSPNPSQAYVRFLFPSLGYDFMVMLKDYTQPNADSSILWDNTIPAPGWQLTLFIVQDNINLKAAAQDQFIARLAAGLGWGTGGTPYAVGKFNEFSAPEQSDPVDVRTIVTGAELDYLTRTGQILPGQTGSTAGGGASSGSSGGTVPTSGGGGGVLTPTQVAQYAYNAGFRGHALVLAVAIAGAESGYDPTSHNNDANTGDDSWGLWQINYFGSLSAHRTALYGPETGMTDPARNAAAAWDVSGHGSSFSPWSTYTSGAYQAHLAAAESAVQTLPNGGN